ncbi:lysozyme [Rappaport israeli]|uniref:lysozyme n=1 Tax=Rappaport israeli TaxID=1839807 RepID=UPI000930FE9E|nr:lysozyme [Rappaport israeli]
MTRQMTSQGMRALIVREGSRNKMYHDAAGLPTIGVGHLLTRSELTSGKIIITGKPVHWRAGLSDKHITALLDQDNDIAEQAVNDLVRVPLTDNQFDALVSFVFNVGVGAFKRSTLLRELNKGDYQSVPHQLRRWVYAAGKPVLKARRESEAMQWLSDYV